MLPALLIVLCVVLRIVPHPPNFAPVGAVAVFAGRTLSPAAALALVTAAMFAGDFALSRLHGYPLLGLETPFIYAGFFLQAVLGRRLRTRRGGAVAAAVLGAGAFFTLSNFGVWLLSGMYAPTWSGLGACYVAALPFLGGTLVGDVVWTAVLSVGYRPLAARLEPRRFWVPVPAKELALI